MAGEAAHPVNDLPPPPHGDAGGRVLGIVLWCLFAAFILCGAFMVLAACGTSSLFGFGRDFCPVVGADDALRRERETGETLRRQVHLAELALLEKPICPLPPPPEPPPQRQLTPKSTAVDKTIVKRGGKTGALKLQITLSWETLDDLDLNVYCPGGRISSAAGKRGPGICGDGVKDLDANGHLTENVSTTPVENMVWAADVPQGEYTIEVIEAFAKDETHKSTVPFDLRIRWNDQETTCSGTVSAVARPATRRDSDGIISGEYKTLTWTLGPSLPACNFEPQTAHLGNGVKD